MDDITFRRAYGCHALAHASKDGEVTICGIRIDNTWAAIDEQTFRNEQPCKDCERKLKRIMRKGTQTRLA